MTCCGRTGAELWDYTQEKKTTICLKIIYWSLSFMLHLFKALIICLYCGLFKNYKLKKIPIRGIKNTF